MGKKHTVTVVPAVERALNILEYLAQQSTSITLKNISTNLGIPSVTTYRLVRYLRSRGYIREDSQIEGEYRLGFKILDLSYLLTKQQDLNAAAKPVMKELSGRTGQTTQLGILRGLGVMYIEQVLPMTPVNIMAGLRTVMPVNVSASGKVLVAFLPTDEQDVFLQNAELPPQTPQSITDISRFKQELRKVKEKGYATDNEEYARGIACLAAPIMDHSEKAIAAIGITGHISAYADSDDYERLTRDVVAAAIKISESMGYTASKKE
ncbi:MAG: IclR family transcriptional regulator [Anaerolineales bacterium]|nr:IclR family transcriptional regulator [Anaerolineales bacterium]